MATQLDLVTATTQTATEYMEEILFHRYIPNYFDLLRDGERAILQTLYGDFKDTTSPIKAALFCGQVEAHYHMHNSQNIFQTAFNMTQSPCPLIKISSTSEKVYIKKLATPSMRYTRFEKTPWGNFVFKFAKFYKQIPNMDYSKTMSEYVATLFPMGLFNKKLNLAKGIQNQMISYNPVEVFNTMKHMIQNPDYNTSDILNILTSPDLYNEGYIILLDSISMQTLWEEGYGKVSILASIDVTRDKIFFYEAPYNSTIPKLRDTFFDEKTNKFIKFKTFTVTDVETNNITADNKAYLTVAYYLNGDYSPLDVQKELYSMTYLQQDISLENYCILPQSIVDTHKRLDIVPIREYLSNCIKFGILNRKYEIQQEIDKIHRKVMVDSLIERLTRVEVTPWLQQLTNTIQDGRSLTYLKNLVSTIPNLKDKEWKYFSGSKILKTELLFDLGNELIKPYKLDDNIYYDGGITKDEVAQVFAITSNNILGRLANDDEYDKVIDSFRNYSAEIDNLKGSLAPNKINEYLLVVLDTWIKATMHTPRTTCYFKNVEAYLSTKMELYNQQVKRQYLTYMSSNKSGSAPVNIVFYADGKSSYYNPLNVKEIPKDIISDKIHTIVECQLKDTIMLFTSVTRIKVPIQKFIKENHYYQFEENYTIQGALIIEDEHIETDDYTTIMVTSFNRIKKIKTKLLAQKIERTIPIPLERGEYFLLIKTLRTDIAEKFAVEVVTNYGIKRRNIKDLLYKNIDGFNTLLSLNWNVYSNSARLVEIDDNKLHVIDSDSVRTLEVNVEHALKRDTFREWKIEDGHTYNHYVDLDYLFDPQGNKITLQQFLNRPDLKLNSTETYLLTVEDSKGIINPYHCVSKSRDTSEFGTTDTLDLSNSDYTTDGNKHFKTVLSTLDKEKSEIDDKQSN